MSFLAFPTPVEAWAMFQYYSQQYTHREMTKRNTLVIESVDSISRDGLDTPIYIIHYKKNEITQSRKSIKLFN